MNQHSSRPVAQGFPLHRRMNGPIQSSGPGGRATQLRPSNPSVMTNGGALRRSLGFNSQIPIRIGFGNQSSSSSSQQASLRARVLERHRQSLVNNSSSQSSVPQAMRTSASSSVSTSQQQQQQQQPIDNAFKVYEEKLQTDFRDFRAMCSRLILQEKEEKEKWHNLCLKIMKERDTARQRISVLISERESHLSSSSSSAAVPTASSAQEKNVTSQTTKRGRDEGTSSAAAQEQASSRSSPVESRLIRGLRLSPLSSPSRSPSAASLNNSSTATDSSSLLSASSESPPSSLNANFVLSSTTSSSSSSSTPPCSDSSSSSSSVVPPLNIMTFNPARSPDDTTCFDVFGEFDIPESRPVKRRKSYDSSFDEPLPFLIAHTDIMYMPMKGRLYCRACLLDKTTNPSKNRNLTTFPTNANWNELRDHCVCEHFAACQDVARLSPADLNELRRRLYK